MPFAYIMKNLQPGMAAKRSNWAGYVKKTAAEGAAEDTYTLTFVNRAGTQKVYTVTAGVISTTDALSMDAEFLAGMLSDDWVSGTIEAFEASRSGTGTW